MRYLLPKRKASNLEENIVRAISNNGETRDWDEILSPLRVIVSDKLGELLETPNVKTRAISSRLT